MDDIDTREIKLLKEIEQLHSELALANGAKVARKNKQLSNREDHFANTLRSTSDGLWDWNLETDNVYYAPRLKSMLGYSENELEDNLHTWATMVHLDDKDVVLNKVQQYLSGETGSFETEMRMYHKEGHEIFVHSLAIKVTRGSSGKPVRLIGTHLDITRRKKAELLNNRYTKILEMIAKGQPATEIYNEIAFMYEERHAGLRCSILELEGSKQLQAGAPSLPKAYCKAIHGLINGPDIGSCGASIYTGERVIVENIETDPKWQDLKHKALSYGLRSCWSEPIKSASGKVLGAFGMYVDHIGIPKKEQSKDLISAARLAGIVMERDKNQRTIQNLAYIDELTKLSSRTSFYMSVESLVKESTRNNCKFGLLYIDLDNFKNVNDSMGHDVGDILLKEVAQRLKNACREVDYIGRLSGDEFCIAINNLEDDYTTTRVAHRCLEFISKPFELTGRVYKPSCSIGIAQYPNDGIDLKTLLKAADIALYSAKDLGKNRFAFYNKTLTHKAEYRFKIEQYLREAIEKQQLTLVYQPKFDLNSGTIISVEALCRWHHPILGEISPLNFISMAEQIGMIKPLTEWVLYTAGHQLTTWRKAGFSPIRIAVNISPSHFIDSDLAPLLKRVIEETKILPSDLELEVTEGVVKTSQESITIFEDLKALGILLAIDDFGTGSSSFVSLKNLNLDFLQIDNYFINEMLSDNKTKLLIGSMIELGHICGHKVTAKGVEKKEQLNILQKLGCDSVQGYLLSKPVSASQISTSLVKI